MSDNEHMDFEFLKLDYKSFLRGANPGEAFKILDSIDDPKQKAEVIFLAGYNEWTALHYAAMHNNYNLCKQILETAPESIKEKFIFLVDERGVTAFQEAAERNYYAICKLILEHVPQDRREALVCSASNIGDTIIHHATQEGDYELLGFILETLYSDNNIQVDEELVRVIADSNDFLRNLSEKVIILKLFIDYPELNFLAQREKARLKGYLLQAMNDVGLGFLDMLEFSKLDHEKGGLPKYLSNRETLTAWDPPFTTSDGENFYDHEVEIDGERRIIRFQGLVSSDDLMEMTNISRELTNNGIETLCTGTHGQHSNCAAGNTRYIAIIELDEKDQEVEWGHYRGGINLSYNDGEYSIYSIFDMENRRYVEPYNFIAEAFLEHNNFKGVVASDNIPKWGFNDNTPKVLVNDDAKETEQSFDDNKDITRQERMAGSEITEANFIDKLRFLITHRALPIEGEAREYQTLLGKKKLERLYLKNLEPLDPKKTLEQEYNEAKENGEEYRGFSTSKPFNLGKKANRLVTVNEGELISSFSAAIDRALVKFIEEVVNKRSVGSKINVKPPAAEVAQTGIAASLGVENDGAEVG